MAKWRVCLSHNLSVVCFSNITERRHGVVESVSDSKSVSRVF